MRTSTDRNDRRRLPYQSPGAPSDGVLNSHSATGAMRAGAGVDGVAVRAEQSSQASHLDHPARCDSASLMLAVVDMGSVSSSRSALAAGRTLQLRSNRATFRRGWPHHRLELARAGLAASQ